MDNNNVQRDGFSSRLGVLFAAAGSAIGLGNIWKFPYITGVYGGAAFILVYLVCIALIGLPVMLSEFTIGRRAQKNAIGSFKKLAGGTPWFLTGWAGFLAAFTILAFYGVVGGWTLDYIVKALTGAYVGADADAIGGMFGALISSPVATVGYQLVFMVLTAAIVYGGIKDGIEKYSKILMPVLLVIIVILDIRAITLPGAGAGVAFLFTPDFSALSAEAVLSALGHAFFSLSLGMGTMITYGSYISKKEDLGSMALQVTIADTAIALLAGLAIFPAVFAFGVEPSAGPGLVFITLPAVFNQMAGGMIWGVLFFSLLAMAALTSAISILEVVVAYLAEEMNVPRKKATIYAATAITALGVFAGLSYTPVLGDVMIPLPGSGSLPIFDWLDKFSANYLLPLGGLFISLFVGFKMKKEDVQDEVTNSGVHPASWLGGYLFLAKFVAPIAILIVFLNGVGLLKF
jgi:NSS family neurotransmitter:Na+ symporter